MAENVFISTPDGLRWVANAAGEAAEATVATTSLETAGADDYVRVDGSQTTFAGDIQVAGVMVDSASPIEVVALGDGRRRSAQRPVFLAKSHPRIPPTRPPRRRAPRNPVDRRVPTP